MICLGTTSVPDLIWEISDLVERESLGLRVRLYGIGVDNVYHPYMSADEGTPTPVT